MDSSGSQLIVMHIMILTAVLIVMPISILIVILIVNLIVVLIQEPANI
jgi:hypothetical protein